MQIGAMRVAIIGPGAMGCMFAAYLHQGGLDVVLLDHRPDRATRLAGQGIQVDGARGAQHVRVATTTDAAAAGPVELVLVCVKAYHTTDALRQHRALVGETTDVLTLQNGLGNLEAMQAVVPPERLLGGSTTMGANLLGEGRVHHAGEGDTFIGEPQGGTSPRVERIAAALTRAGVVARVHEHIQEIIWHKLIVNVGINALTAILGVCNGELLEDEAARALMRDAVSEGVRAAATQGLRLDQQAMQERVAEVARRTARNRSSMLQDVRAGRRTEVDVINAAVARVADAPVNRTLARLVHAVEAVSARTGSPADVT